MKKLIFNVKKVLFYIVFLLFPTLIFGQEYLSGVVGNPILKERAAHEAPGLKSTFVNYLPVKLPFFDNFSKITVYPDTSRWIDNEAYINADFPYFPVDYGVATMDVIDANGNLYPEASPFTFIADHLTSKPIRLDAKFDENGDSIGPLSPEDSVYLSFYYQPQGLGDMPMDYDSLVLEFGFYNALDTIFTVDTIFIPDTILVYDTTIVPEILFSHFDSVWVYGQEYDMSAYDNEFLPPLDTIFPPFGCDNIPTVLIDTLFVDDSLRIPCDSVFKRNTKWEYIWSARGDTLSRFIEKNDVFFKYVKIPVTDEKWFRNDFQFRFKTYSTISNINSWQSNTDHWHIDRVYLDKDRAGDDQFKREISFAEDPPGFLYDFTSIPAYQFSQNIAELKKDSIPIYINNLDSVSHTLTYKYFIQKPDGDTIFNTGLTPISQPLLPLMDQDAGNFQPFANPPVKYYFSTAEDSTTYKIIHIVYDNDSTDVGDTIVTKQVFSNYMSYDDGTAEAGYGLSPATAMLAIKFQSTRKDTLWGVRIYFNKTLAENNNHLFHLTVRDDNNGIPGDTIYTEKNLRPQFTKGLNRFYDLVFKKYVPLSVENFYVGWTQTTNHNLNIGFDRNTNTQNKIFYNTDGTWTKSAFEGSVMIRPLLGKPLGDYASDTSKTSYNKALVIRPNPPLSQNDVFIDLPAGYNDPKVIDLLTLKVSDLCGQVLYSGPYAKKISVRDLPKGIFIITVFDNAYNNRFSAKLVIVK